MTKDDELRLIEKAKKGNSAAFQSLVEESQKLVYNLAYKLTGNEEDALDVSQEAYLKAYQSLSLFRGDSRFSVWIYRLTYNSAMDFLRRNNRGKIVSLSVENVNGDEEELEIEDGTPLPEEQVERRALQDAVRHAVMKLPDDKRQVIVMREFSGMSYSAIAEALGVEEGTVKSRISRARISLTEILKKEGTFSFLDTSNKMKGGPQDE